MFRRLLLATAAVVSLWSMTHAVLGEQKATSGPSSAKCLVEVKGVHYTETFASLLKSATEAPLNYSMSGAA
jgi:hypothetical protein